MPIHRYYLNVYPFTADLTPALSLLPPSTHSRILRYHFPADRALSCGSALLQRLLVCRTHPENHPSLRSVTLYRDPTTKRPSYRPDSPSATTIEDYNVSHHNPRESPVGEKCVVALGGRTCDTSGMATRRRSRMGVDVVPTHHKPDRKSMTSFLAAFTEIGSDVFTPHEVQVILGYSSLEERVRALYLHWCVKEAYTKATGAGLAEELMKIEFRKVRLFDLEGGTDVFTDVELWLDGVNVSEKWYIEVTFIEGLTGGEKEGFYIALVTEKEGLELEDMENPKQWVELGFEEDIRKPWGGGGASDPAAPLRGSSTM
jgi:phosphopantetheinyl transferase (holo-ACP synthase)